MKYLLSVFLLSLLLYSCSKSTVPVASTIPDGCDSMAFSYRNDIKPIIASNCSGTGCHNGGNNNYDFTTYEGLADRILAGTVQYRLQLPNDDPQHMPQNGTMGACNQYRVLTWIHQGYRNN
jgi:hypothetical protein